MRKDTGYWQDIENIKYELAQFVDEDGLLKNYTHINTIRPMLTRAISEHHGGIHAVRCLLELDKKRCNICKKVKLLSEFRTTRGESGRIMIRDGQCKQCNYESVSAYRETDSGMAANICRLTKSRARKNGWDYDIDKQWVLNRLNCIGWKCQVTGALFERTGVNFFESWSSVSVDRIDSSKGYTKDNIQFVTAWVNKAKSNLPMDLFVKFCCDVASHQKEVACEGQRRL